MVSAEQEKPFFSVEFALNIEGRGVVVLCQCPDPLSVRVQPGDLLEFLLPDGRMLRSNVKALDMVMDARPGLLGLCLPVEISKDDIPYGSKLRIAHTNN
ncbi:MAG TPA: hypothetical protein VG099_18170 [Gemmataceae bacterium]|jgi:hypothetical protein|nr:hypothetical protein [Gemmataceae bacterium]